MKNKKILAYVVIPAIIISALAGVRIASAKGILGGFGFGGAGFLSTSPDQIAAQQQTAFDNWAQFLGISDSDVKDAWAQGQSIKDLAVSKGITPDQLGQKIQDRRMEQMKAALKILVENGTITQAQADQKIQFFQTNSKNGKVGWGHMGRMEHMMGVN